MSTSDTDPLVQEIENLLRLLAQKPELPDPLRASVQRLSLAGPVVKYLKVAENQKRAYRPHNIALLYVPAILERQRLAREAQSAMALVYANHDDAARDSFASAEADLERVRRFCLSAAQQRGTLVAQVRRLMIQYQIDRYRDPLELEELGLAAANYIGMRFPVPLNWTADIGSPARGDPSRITLSVSSDWFARIDAHHAMRVSAGLPQTRWLARRKVSTQAVFVEHPRRALDIQDRQSVPATWELVEQLEARHPILRFLLMVFPDYLTAATTLWGGRGAATVTAIEAGERLRDATQDVLLSALNDIQIALRDDKKAYGLAAPLYFDVVGIIAKDIAAGPARDEFFGAMAFAFDLAWPPTAWEPHKMALLLGGFGVMALGFCLTGPMGVLGVAALSASFAVVELVLQFEDLQRAWIEAEASEAEVALSLLDPHLNAVETDRSLGFEFAFFAFSVLLIAVDLHQLRRGFRAIAKGAAAAPRPPRPPDRDGLVVGRAGGAVSDQKLARAPDLSIEGGPPQSPMPDNGVTDVPGVARMRADPTAAPAVQARAADRAVRGTDASIPPDPKPIAPPPDAPTATGETKTPPRPEVPATAPLPSQRGVADETGPVAQPPPKPATLARPMYITRPRVIGNTLAEDPETLHPVLQDLVADGMIFDKSTTGRLLYRNPKVKGSRFRLVWPNDQIPLNSVQTRLHAEDVLTDRLHPEDADLFGDWAPVYKELEDVGAAVVLDDWSGLGALAEPRLVRFYDADVPGRGNSALGDWFDLKTRARRVRGLGPDGEAEAKALRGVLSAKVDRHSRVINPLDDADKTAEIAARKEVSTAFFKAIGIAQDAPSMRALLGYGSGHPSDAVMNAYLSRLPNPLARRGLHNGIEAWFYLVDAGAATAAWLPRSEIDFGHIVDVVVYHALTRNIEAELLAAVRRGKMTQGEFTAAKATIRRVLKDCPENVVPEPKAINRTKGAALKLQVTYASDITFEEAMWRKFDVEQQIGVDDKHLVPGALRALIRDLDRSLTFESKIVRKWVEIVSFFDPSAPPTLTP